MATSFSSRLSTAPEEGCKAPCVTVSLTNITLSGEQTIGVTAVVTGDRVLVAGQTDSAENGIWVCNSGAWTRAKDWNTAEDVAPGMLIPVSATEELYQTKPFTGTYNPGVTEITFGVGILSARSVETQTGSQAVSGLFTLTTTTYTPGANNLEVDHNGQRLNITTDYTEPSASTVQIVPARVINPDDIFTFRTNTTVSNSVTTTTAITHTRGGVAHNLATFLDRLVMEFDTMADAIASTKVYEGAVLLIKDRANSTWDVVLSSGVTENGYNIVQGVGVGTLSFVLRQPECIFAKAFGVRDGVDSTAALQAAIDYAQSLNTLGGYGYQWTPKVVLPPGRMIITGEITIDDTKEIIITGAGMTATILNCSTSAAFRSVFYTGANQSTFHKFAKFAIYGGGDIQYGIYAPFVDHTIYSELRVSGTTVGALYNKYGWSCDFERCELTSNTGHGLILENNSNAANVMGCKIYQNTGFGIWANQSHAVKVLGGTIENNRAGGIMFNLVDGFFVTTYMEGNGDTGYTYTTPALTVKAQVILNESGTPETKLAAANGNNGTFAGMQTAVHADNTCVIYASSYDSLVIDGWYIDDDPLAATIPLLKTHISATYSSPDNTVIKGVTTTQSPSKIMQGIECDGYTAPAASTWAHLHDYYRTPRFDLGATHGADPTAYTNVAASSTALTFALLSSYRNGVPVYSSTQTGAGSSHVYAFSIPTSDIEDYDDRYFYAVMWVKAATGTPGFTFYADGGGGSITSMGSEGALTNGVWTRRVLIFKGNGSGTIRIGVRQYNGNASDVVHFTRPVVSLIGVHANNYGVGF